MTRYLATLLWIAVLAVGIPGIPGGHIGLAMIVAAAFVVAVVVVDQDHRVAPAIGPCAVAQERRRHGTFRRLSSPGTAGRPRPRAPGFGFRPA